MLLNKYQRQQRLRPEEQIDPMMRSMMDAVRQVYTQNTGEEQVSTEEEPTDENINQSPTTETTTVP